MDKELKALIEYLESLLLQLDKPSQEATNYIVEQALKTLENLTIQDSKLVFDNTALKELVKLETKLTNYLNNSPYSNGVKELLTGFAGIDNNLTAIHKFNGVDNINSIASPIKKAFVAQAQELLLNNGVKYEVIQPLKALITQQALTGQSVSKVKKNIESLKEQGITIGTNKVQNLHNYSTQIARDVVYGYQGAINAKVAEEYGLNGFIYQGGLVTDSRPICTKLANKERFDLEYLKSTLANTSKDGMIPNTTVDNFAVYRGGFNCRHIAIPIRIEI